MTAPVIGFAGMTHLGLVSATVAASIGFDVVAFDADDLLIFGLQRGETPIVEPGLPQLLADFARRMTFTSSLSALSRCDVVYVAVDVPTDDQGRSDLGSINAMIQRVTHALGQNSTLVVLCQVPPGFTRALGLSAERLYYQVETLVFGRAVERASKPERFIIGCAEPQLPLPAALSTFLEAFRCPILPMRYESAELAKISINCCLVASVSVANMLAEISEAIGADWAEIVPALKLDPRIGPHAYLNPGLGIAGGNLERDLRTVLDIGESRHTDTQIVQAWLRNSARRKDWAWRVLSERVLAGKPDAAVAVLGLAYKENTHSTKNSPALALLDRLRGNAVTVHDPVVPASIVPWARGASDPLAAASGADALVIATPWPQYKAIDARELARVMTGREILDPYRLLDMHACAAAGFAYHALGMPPYARKA